jgi:hypothetical protein
MSKDQRDAIRVWIPPEIVSFCSEDEKADFVADLVAAFRADITKHVRAIRKAIVDSNLERVRREAHAMMLIADQMGAESVSGIVHELALATDLTAAPWLSERVDAVETCFAEAYRRMLDQWIVLGTASL